MDFIKLDGGFKSRKFWFAVLTQFCILATALLSTAIPSLQPLYATIVGGVTGVFALYLGGNVSTRWVHGKLSSVGPDVPKDVPENDNGAQDSGAAVKLKGM